MIGGRPTWKKSVTGGVSVFGGISCPDLFGCPLSMISSHHDVNSSVPSCLSYPNEMTLLKPQNKTTLLFKFLFSGNWSQQCCDQADQN